MKKFIAFTLSALLLITCLTGCSEKIKEGEIIKKVFTPEYDQIMIIPMTISNGETCSTIMIPYIYHYSDDWAITIKAMVDGEEKTATYHVTQEVYDECELGGQFVYDESYCKDECPYTREEQ